jgi:photosystem II stability/assembly factor-like uncharacterized protein
VSTDGGTVWTQKDSYYGDGGCCIVHPESANVIITGGQGPSTQTNWSFVISHSRDNGNTWTRCNLSGTLSGWCHALAVAPSAPEVIYAAGQVTGSGAVYRSSTRGVSWQPTTTAPADTIYGLAVLPGDANRVIAATHSGAYLSTDGGANWSSLGGGSRLRAIAVHPFGPDTLAVAGDQGVMISRNAGQTWTPLNQGLDTLAVTSLSFCGTGGTQLVAGTAGRGCFVWSFVSGVSEGPATGGRRLLHIASPFAGWTCARGRERESFELYDVTGKLVATQPGARIGEALPAGSYSVRSRTGETARVVKTR